MNRVFAFQIHSWRRAEASKSASKPRLVKRRAKVRKSHL